jgi:hypothetical protein
MSLSNFSQKQSFISMDPNLAVEGSIVLGIGHILDTWIELIKMILSIKCLQNVTVTNKQSSRYSNTYYVWKYF